jgi:hypothetical protein
MDAARESLLLLRSYEGAGYRRSRLPIGLMLSDSAKCDKKYDEAVRG